MKTSEQRNWSLYNQKLKSQARVELYVSDELFSGYAGPRKPGGVVLYSDALIESGLLLRRYFGLGLRQTEGFLSSLARLIQPQSAPHIPDYTTLCRRSKTLNVSLNAKLSGLKKGYVMAIDSTGLSLLSGDSWQRHKHRIKRGNASWHKLHIAIDVDSGEILACDDTPATTNDCLMLPPLMQALPDIPLDAVAADMAYDTVDCRKAIWEAGARQLIQPKASAVHSADLATPKPPHITRILSERDDAIRYAQTNAINGDEAPAKAQWKKLTGYHQRSLVETTMSRLKAHIGSELKSQTPATKHTECRITCKLLNILNQA